MTDSSLRVTEAHIDAARAAGACYLPELGADPADIPQADLIWFEEHCPQFGLTLWLLTGDGYGYGDGHGYGDGYGYGDGDGDGYGDGYGYGYGDGDGDGDGYGVNPDA